MKVKVLVEIGIDDDKCNACPYWKVDTERIDDIFIAEYHCKLFSRDLNIRDRCNECLLAEFPLKALLEGE